MLVRPEGRAAAALRIETEATAGLKQEQNSSPGPRSSKCMHSTEKETYRFSVDGAL